MPAYGKYQKPLEPKKGLNPVWRGIGCLLMVIVPLISWGLTLLAVPPLKDNNLVPPDLLGVVNFPAWVAKVPLVAQAAAWIHTIPDLWIKLIVFFVILILLAAVGSLIYTPIAQFMGPPRYSEMDVIPSGHKPKVYKR